MKKPLFFLVLIFAAPKIFAQWQVAGGYVGITTATTYFICQGEIRVGAGTFLSKGKTICTDLKSDPAGTIRGTGAYTIEGNLVNLGTILDNTNFTMSGDAPATITTSGDALYNLILKKTGGGTIVSLADPLKINKKLTFTGASNKLALANFDLTFASAATVGSASSVKFVATTGTGKVFKQNIGATAFTFPVGATTAGTWNSLTVKNTGTTDDIGVRVLADALSGGPTGSPLTSDAVAASWQISENTPGGSNLTVTPAWPTADQLPGFLKTACAVRRWNGSVWDSAPLGAATGTGTATSPFKRERAGIAADGYFAVLDGGFPIPPAAAIRDDEKTGVEIFPNPATERVFVRANVPVAGSLRVFDLNGREVLFLKKPAVADGIWLDVARLGAGIYVVEISGAGGEKLVDRFSVFR